MAMTPEEIFNQQLMSESGDGVNGGVYTPPNAGMNLNPHSQQWSAAQNNQSAVNQERIKCGVLMKEDSKLNNNVIRYFKNNLHKLNRRNIVFKWVIVYEEEEELYDEQGITKFPTLVYDDVNISGVSNIVRFLDITSQNGGDAALDDFNQRSNGGNMQRNGNQQGNRNNHGNSQGNRNTPRGPSVNQISQGDDIKDYFMNALKDDNMDMDTEPDPSSEISKRLAAMNNARRSAGMAINGQGSSNPELHEAAAKKRVHFTDPVDDNPRNQQYNNYGQNNNSRNNTNVQLSTRTMDLIKQGGSGDQDDDMMDKFWANQEETEL